MFFRVLMRVLSCSTSVTDNITVHDFQEDCYICCGRRRLYKQLTNVLRITVN